MATYFFITITFIIIGLFLFSLSESHGRSSQYARDKDFKAKQPTETSKSTTHKHPI
ncbi:MAG: hypothetical protein ACI96N_002372 [Arenicella sp.]|jgi:hypothetical protein